MQLQYATELLDSGKSYKQVEAMTGISKSTLIRARIAQKAPAMCQKHTAGEIFLSLIS